MGFEVRGLAVGLRDKRMFEACQNHRLESVSPLL